MKTPQISIVMPVYNAQEYLCQSIDSIIQQTFTDFELIIVDDGSTDKSAEIISDYKDPRIHHILNEHNFIQSLNNGITAAVGKYIARMDADDIMLPKRLQLQYEFMENNPNVDISGSWMQSFGQREYVMKNATDHQGILCQAILHSPLYHPTIIMKRSIIHSFPFLDNVSQLYNEKYTYAEDYHCWIELIKKGSVFANIPEVLVKYRCSNNQLTVIKQKEILACTVKIQNEYIEYVMESIVKKDYEYYDVLDNLIGLFNNNKLSFSDLKQIVYIIYANLNL
ncbi:glycosyltransferase family 2 protein [Dysgonomonas sp. ZJ709]|uniref:glycosyltransferase family 2 protein n=1 Tax=Dysgonomonas sp. ZJ709 TaxID=2709797 RepID=UPI0013E9FC35|nr:glycosyltransferase family 2 protein [Dysgonomonas sp. ZJ709]